MKHLPGHLNKLKRRTSRWEELQDFEGEADAEMAAGNLLRQRIELNQKNFELEEEALENAYGKWDGEAPTKPKLNDFQRQLNQIAHEIRKNHKHLMKKKPKQKLAKKAEKKQELNLLGKKISAVKKTIKAKLESLSEQKKKAANYRGQTTPARSERELKKIAKRAQTKSIQDRFAPKAVKGKIKRELIEKTLSKEQNLKKKRKSVAITRDPPSYH